MANNTISVVPSGVPDKEQILPINVTFTDTNGQTTVIPTILPTAGRGPAGKDGTSWYLGSSEPTDSSFSIQGSPEVGDIYLCTVSCKLYNYTGSEWIYTDTLQVKGLVGVSKLTGEKDGETVHLNISYSDGSTDVFSFDIPVPKQVDLSSYISTKAISTGVSPNSLAVGDDTINYKVNNLEVGNSLNISGVTIFTKTPKVKLADGLDTAPVNTSTQVDVPTKGWVDQNYVVKNTALPANLSADKTNYTVSTDIYFTGKASFTSPVTVESTGEDTPGNTTSLVASTSWVDKYYAQSNSVLPAKYTSSNNVATVSASTVYTAPVSLTHSLSDTPGNTGQSVATTQWVDQHYLPRSTVYVTTQDDTTHSGVKSIYIDKSTSGVTVQTTTGQTTSLQVSGNYVTTPADPNLGSSVKSIGIDKDTQRFIGKTDDGRVIHSASLSDISPLITTAAAMVGIPQPWPTNDIPAGYLLCDGSGFDTTLYPALAKVYPTGKLPDLRGMFIRGLDPTGNVDNAKPSPRTVLSYEEGSWLVHDTSWQVLNFVGNGTDHTVDFSALGWDRVSTNDTTGVQVNIATPQTGESANAIGTNTDNLGVSRPKNIAFNYIVFTGAGLRSIDVGTAPVDSTLYFSSKGGTLNGSVISTDVNGDTHYTIQPYQPNEKGYFQIDYGTSGNTKIGILNNDPSQLNISLSNNNTTSTWTFNRDKQSITTPNGQTLSTQEWVDSNYVTKSSLGDSVTQLQQTVTQTTNEINTSITPKLNALDNTLTNQINEEASRAQKAEATLTQSVSSISTDISNEKQRAESVESTLQTSIDGEVSRAKNAESTISENVQQLTTNLTNETNRATQAEQQLSNEISAETKRAQDAEAKIQNSLSNYAPLDAVDYSKLSDLKLQAQTAANLSSAMVGIPQPWPGEVIPDGFLLCDGSSFDTNRYNLLAKVYPNGKLPDLRGMFIRGLDPTGNVDSTGTSARTILSFEEGTVDAYSYTTDNAGVVYNNGGTPFKTKGLDWVSDVTQHYSISLSNAHAGSWSTGVAGLSNAYSVVGVTRPKNIAFNYIVYTGDSLAPASVGLLSSDNVNFSGRVSFTSIPTLQMTDTAPVSDSTKTQLASKMWVDTNYLSKSTPINNNTINMMPSLVGTPIPWPGDTVPDGYLLCDGSGFDPSVYPLLSEVYPSNKLPDLRGMFIRGLDPTGNIDNYQGGNRNLLSFEEGSYQVIFSGSSASLNTNNPGQGNNNPELATYGMDKPANVATANGLGVRDSRGGGWDQGNGEYNSIGIARPKNIAFNYIVYTGKTLLKTTQNLMASNDIDFAGKVSFDKTPVLKSNDIAPINSTNANDAASKNWVDSNYADKASLQTTVSTLASLIGIPMPWPSNVIPQGYFLCDGSTFDTTKYTALAQVYPSGKLPDLRGMFIRGVDPSGNIDNAGGKGRQVLSTEDGTYLINAENQNAWAVVPSHNKGTDMGLDFPNSSSPVTGWAIFGNYTAVPPYTVQMTAQSPDNFYGTTRPKNVAFNYIVFTGQGVNTGIITSGNTQGDTTFTGNITFSKNTAFDQGLTLSSNNTYSGFALSPSILLNVGSGNTTGSMSLWSQVDAYRSNSMQLNIGGNSPGEEYRCFSFNPHCKTILSPDYNPYPEAMGFGNHQRVVTQYFYVQITTDVQQIFFPTPFASATGVNIQCTLTGYPNSGIAERMPYFGAPISTNTKYPVTANSFWVDMSQAGSWQGLGFWVAATGLMN